jgi:hypothetical protein
LLYQQRYKSRRSTYPLRMSYSASLRRFREHYLELQGLIHGLIASDCHKFAPCRTPMVKMPCIPDTLYRCLRTQNPFPLDGRGNDSSEHKWFVLHLQTSTVLMTFPLSTFFTAVCISSAGYFTIRSVKGNFPSRHALTSIGMNS